MSKENEKKFHTHIDENGNEYTHSHDGHEDHSHDHGTHSHENEDHSHDHETHSHEHEDHSHEHQHHEHEGHSHPHGHSHSHTHDPKEMKKIINRISKSIGHMESVKRMLEDGEDCADVLVQIAAVKSEINNAGKALLKEHLEHCIVEAVAQNDIDSIEKMNKAIDYFMK